MRNPPTAISNDRLMPTSLPKTANVLLLVSSLTQHETTLCTDLLQNRQSQHTNVLQIDFTRSPGDLIETWSADSHQLPEKIKIITVGQRTHTSPTDDVPFNVSFESIGNAGNLTDMGVEITRTLSEWNTSSSRTLCCFHSLTPLLQYTEFEKAYRFMHILTGHMANHRVLAHYHIDPNAHERNRLHKLKPIFDAVVTIDDDGEPELLMR